MSRSRQIVDRGKALLAQLQHLRSPSARLVADLMVALLLVAGTTLCLLVVTAFVELRHVSTAYLIPVLIAATKVSVSSAILAAVGGIAASAFFFYAPIYDFRVADTAQLLDLPLFVFVAIITGELAARAHSHAAEAERREVEMRALYAFSRRLAVATDAPEIYAAIQDHISAMLQRPVFFFEASAADFGQPVRRPPDGLPFAVQEAVNSALARPGGATSRSIVDDRTGAQWLICPISISASPGLLAIDAGGGSKQSLDDTQKRVDAVVADAAATLERLDVARAIGEAKLRTESDTLRAALMGSVSHGLRTPLASILGSASILVDAPSVQREPRLAALAGIVRDEAERLDGDIQKLLDASRISSAGIRPHVTWADPADIVNAAIASQRRALSNHQIVMQVADDIPMAHVDPVLIEQALCQIIDNAAKYSSPGSCIAIEVGDRAGQVAITVTDSGSGLTAQDQEHMFERFYRGSRSRETSGSGLGLWIAQAFVAACGGRMEAASEGAGRGSRMTIVLPRATVAPERLRTEVE